MLIHGLKAAICDSCTKHAYAAVKDFDRVTELVLKNKPKKRSA